MIEPFNANNYLDCVNRGVFAEEDTVLLSNQYRATDLSVMLKTALRAIELLSERVAELESAKGDGK